MDSGGSSKSKSSTRIYSIDTLNANAFVVVLEDLHIRLAFEREPACAPLAHAHAMSKAVAIDLHRAPFGLRLEMLRIEDGVSQRLSDGARGDRSPAAVFAHADPIRTRSS